MHGCAAIAALMMACGVQHTDGNGGQPSGSNPNTGPGSTPGGTAASCPLGVDNFTMDLGLTNPTQVLDLAVDLSGNAFVAASVSTFTPAVAGVFEVSAFAQVMSILPAGSQVAVDAQGNVFIAGSFTEPLDLGLGMMVPNGIDTFIAKLDAKGHLVFAKQLGLCGDGLISLALSHDGRIAVSGVAMGTAILSASGDVQLVLADAGFVAFDSKGNLVIAESLAAGVAIAPLATDFNVRADEVVILEVDASGQAIFRQSFTGGAMFTGVAIDANDHIALVGFASGAITFFGTTITPHDSLESGRVSGAFLIELDAGCSVVMVRDLNMVEANAVAFDLKGDIFIAGATTGNTGFFRIQTVVGIDARGGDIVIGTTAEFDGRATGIAADACGAVIFSSVRQDTPSVPSAIRAIVQKITL